MEGIHIRTKWQWYKEGEKLSKFFLNRGKFNGMQSQIRQVTVNDKEITELNKIQNEIRNFHETIFLKKWL